MTMTGTTTRTHLLTTTDAQRRVTDYRRIDAGTSVYVSRVHDDGTCEIRLPGTLATQRVYLATIVPA